MGNRVIRVLAAALTLVVLAACGGSDDSSDATSSQSTPQATAAAAGADSSRTTPQAQATTAATTTSQAAATAQPAAPQAITVKAGDYFFEPKEIRVRPGKVVVTMPNEGPERPHTFTVKNKSGSGDLFKSERVNQGQTATLEFEIMEEGTYEVYCNLPGHADRGQRGTLTVSRS